MTTKQTPKSCSCFHCKHGKGSKRGHFMMNKKERTLRQRSKLALKKNPENAVVGVAPMGGYFD